MQVSLLFVKEETKESKGNDRQSSLLSGIQCNNISKSINNTVFLVVGRDIRCRIQITVTPHHVLPQSGWISYWITQGENDIPSVVELFRMRYDQLKPKTSLKKARE
jgi:hypothetical protein